MIRPFRHLFVSCQENKVVSCHVRESEYLHQRQQKYVILCVPVPIILAQKDTELKLNTLIQNPICEDHSGK